MSTDSEVFKDLFKSLVNLISKNIKKNKQGKNKYLFKLIRNINSLASLR